MKRHVASKFRVKEKGEYSVERSQTESFQILP